VGGECSGEGHKDDSRVIVKGRGYDGDLSRDELLILLDWNSASRLGA
jgi:hypothetical protein